MAQLKRPYAQQALQTCTPETAVCKYSAKYMFLQIWQKPHKNM